MQRLASAYVATALARIHQLISSGYEAIRVHDLRSAKEEVITGLLVQAMRSAIEDQTFPQWGAQFSIHEERPVSSRSRVGKERPKIDFEMELVTRRPRPRFPFEAKRLCRSDSVAEYLGPDGLGCFLSGTYPSPQRIAGMIGYVQEETIAAWVGRIERKLDEERERHCLSPAPSPVWCLGPLCVTPQDTYISQHHRKRPA